MLTVRNEAEGAALKKRLEDPFRIYCGKIGAPNYLLDVVVKTEEADIQKFREQKAIEDQQLILKTVQEKEKRDQDKLKNDQNKPLMLGYNIKDEPMQMEEIQDEERRVTVQGYVFDVDIRKLRSGRSLLIVKATDYTDSLQIKMFSKGDEDAAAFELVKKGMWIKARGSIQTDMYTNELKEMQRKERRVTVQGYVFDVDIRKLRSGRSLIIVKATDYTDSLQIKMFSKGDEDAAAFELVKKGMWIKARGSIQTDMYTNELAMMANDIHEVKVALRKDTAPEDSKRVELHAHTTMSQLDAVVSPTRLIEQAARWGHQAVAITDHAGVQGYPEAHKAGKKNDIKVIYGVEVNLVDDGVPIAYNVHDIDLKTGTYVVFDVETTGLSAVYDTIIELAGVKIHDGEVIDRYESFANPHHPLSQTTTDLTGITDEMVKDAPEVDQVLKEFHAWMEDSILVAHNASFDIGFLNQGFKRIDYDKVENPVIDTLELARFLIPELKNHRLNTLCKHLDIELTQHHRAIYDAEATGYLLWKLVQGLLEKEILNHNQLNNHIGEGDAYQRSRPYHCILLAKNQEGLKNIYKLVSYSHIDYFYRVPRIPRSLLEKLREGILVGSGCDKGEVFETMMQ